MWKNILLIAVIILIIFSNNIWGYFSFRNYCQNQYGLKIYEKLEKNKGVIVPNSAVAYGFALNKNVLFARYEEKGVLHDLFYVTQSDGKKIRNESYAYANVAAEYRLTDETQQLPKEYFIVKIKKAIYRISDNKLMMEYYNFEHADFDPVSTPFGDGLWEYCGRFGDSFKGPSFVALRDDSKSYIFFK